jgi:hypothetical protein
MPPIKELNVLGGLKGASADAKVAEKRGGLHQRGRLVTDLARQRRFLDAFAAHGGAAHGGAAHGGAAHGGAAHGGAAHAGRADDLAWYRALFDLKGGLKSGDISPGYAALSDARIARAAAALPETRFILLLREPADRLWSALRMHVRSGRLDAALLSDWPRLEDHLARRQHRGWFPSRVWRAWSAALPPGRLAFWFFEDIAARPQQVVDEICRHVGVAPGPGRRPADFNRKGRHGKSAMPPAIADGLAAFFAAERSTSAALFGGHAAGWPAS